jgi:hypothetical protein
MQLEPRHRRIATYLYVQDLLSGARVLAVGEGAPGEETLLRARGATAVTWVAVGAPLPEGPFDLVLALEVDEPDVARVAQAARAALAPTGSLVLACDSRDRPSSVPAAAATDKPPHGISYFELVDRLSPLFEEVRMIGEAPFAGATLAEYGAGEPEPVLDGTLVERGERVERYVAVGGPKRVAPRGYAVVQLPASELAPAPSPSPSMTAPPADLEQRLAALEGECQKLREREEAARAESWKHLKARSEAEAQAASVREDTVRKLKDARKLASVELTRAMEEATKKAISLKDELGRTQRELTEASRALAEARAAGDEAVALRGRVAALEADVTQKDAALERATHAAAHDRARAERLLTDERRALGERVEAKAQAAQAEARAAALSSDLERVRARLADVETALRGESERVGTIEEALRRVAVGAGEPEGA